MPKKVSFVVSLLKKIFCRQSLQKTAYERAGGESAIDRLVDEFYGVMQEDPNAKECFATHAGRDMKEAGIKLKAFLSGWLGGPPIYMEKYGHPRLRMRHFPFSIGPIEAEQWLYCMRTALESSCIDPAVSEELMRAFEGITQLIKNQTSQD